MLQARGFDAHPERSYTPPIETEVNRFPYGWRYVMKPSPTGEEVYDQIPLTAADLLNPQLGDQVPQRNAHFQVLLDLASSLKTYYAKDPTMGVFSDLIMDWGIPGLSGLAPDLALIPNVKHKDADRGTFKVVEEGTRPSLVIEVMSPGHPGDDTNKVTVYARAGIAEYLLIKLDLKFEVPHYELLGYRLESGVYRPLTPDAQGRLLSQTLQLWFEVSDQGRQVRVTEVRTGRRLLTPTETEEARAAAEAQVATLETARLAAEAQVATLETARQQEQAARLAAEARTQAEAQARSLLEKRLRELEELLKFRS